MEKLRLVSSVSGGLALLRKLRYLSIIFVLNVYQAVLESHLRYADIVLLRRFNEVSGQVAKLCLSSEKIAWSNFII